MPALNNLALCITPIGRLHEAANILESIFDQLFADLSGQTICAESNYGLGDKLIFLRFIPLLKATLALTRHANHFKQK